MSAVTYELHDNIAVLTLDDGKANALGPAVLEELAAGIAKAESEAGALVVAGRPGKFCAGFDLKVMMSGPEAAQKLVKHGGAVFLQLYEAGLPVVLACTGHALAGGALLLLTGDTRIGIKGPFKIGLNETSIGMQLPILGQELARDRLDPRHLTSAVIQARIHSPEEAVEAGYLDRIVDPEELRGAAMAEAKRLAAIPKAAYAGTKKQLRSRTIAYVRETLDWDIKRLTSPTP